MHGGDQLCGRAEVQDDHGGWLQDGGSGPEYFTHGSDEEIRRGENAALF